MVHDGVQLGKLTSRERDVLLMAADGLSSPYIASRLQLSPATVNTLLLSSFGKLGVCDRAAAVAAAQAGGLLEREPA